MADKYKVVFLPKDLEVRGGNTAKVQEIMEKILNEEARNGWRLDQIGQIMVGERPGCLAGLFGASTVYCNYNMMVFVFFLGKKKYGKSKMLFLGEEKPAENLKTGYLRFCRQCLLYFRSRCTSVKPTSPLPKMHKIEG